jgi:dipeptidyl aminopeptidase/acylaminoacyl peptidase
MRCVSGSESFPALTNHESPGPFPDGRNFVRFGTAAPNLGPDTNGAGLRQMLLEHLPALGSWSSDGRRIVYDTTIDGNSDVFVMDTSGGSPTRLTFETSDERFPSWSRDGRWIYFSSTRAGATPDIWRIPAEGGSAVRITYHGGVQARESPHGEYLYYLDRYPPPERMGRPTGAHARANAGSRQGRS